jgi:signal transduction histidine kinase
MIQNVVLHAEARTVRITSQIPGSGLIQLSIEDDGKGFDVASPSNPLTCTFPVGVSPPSPSVTHNA